jgi:hypothetical protein
MAKTKGVVLGEGFHNKVSPSGALIGVREGYGAVPPRAPKGMEGTVNRQFQGEQETNRANGATGTPAQQALGNPDETSITRFAGRYGVSRAAGGQDLNDPAANGNGVMFDGMSRETGYTPPTAETLDSPVRKGAPEFDTRFIRTENIAHLGQGIGAQPSQAADDIRAIDDGVMSRD